MNRAQQLKDSLDHFARISDLLGDVLTPDLSEDAAIEAQALEAEIVALRERIRILRQETSLVWDYSPDQDYELRAVFVHRGKSA